MKKIIILIMMILSSISLASCKNNSNSLIYPEIDICYTSYSEFVSVLENMEDLDSYVTMIDPRKFFLSFEKDSIFYNQIRYERYRFVNGEGPLMFQQQMICATDIMTLEVEIQETGRTEKANFSNDTTYNKQIQNHAFYASSGADFEFIRSFNNNEFQFHMFLDIRGYKEPYDIKTEEDLNSKINEFCFEGEVGLEAFIRYFMSFLEEIKF